MRLRYLFAASILATAVAAASTTPTLAQQVTLKLHHFVPAQANQQKFWFEPWAKKLEQESGGSRICSCCLLQLIPGVAGDRKSVV